MSLTVRMHYDGKNFIPDEPVDIPKNQPLEAVLTILVPFPVRSFEREAAWKNLLRMCKPLPILPDELLRRDKMYEDRL